MNIPAPLSRPAVLSVRDAARYGGGRLGGAYPLMGRAREALVHWQQQNRYHFRRSLAAQAHAAGPQLAILGHLWLAKVDLEGRQQDFGLASCRVVTTAGVNYIVDAFQNLVEPENLRYHGIGTGTNAEAVGNTALQTELTTQYQTDNTRPTGTTGEQAGNANVYETTATITVDASVAITEHGIFSQAATGGGTLLDRSVFAAVNLASGESLQATYQLTFTAGT